MYDKAYVHGYSPREADRLIVQAAALTELLQRDTRYPPGARVLEAGCGVGAQTVMMAATSPAAEITPADISTTSLAAAEARVTAAVFDNVTFQQADIFDHISVCFVLEHLPDPVEPLQALKTKLPAGGRITAIKRDHGAAYFHPDGEAARQAIQCLTDLQAGGNWRMGRQLYPLLDEAGCQNISISPRMADADAGKPALVEGVGDRALAASMTDEVNGTQGVADLYRTAGTDGTFCCSFSKGMALKGVGHG